MHLFIILLEEWKQQVLGKKKKPARFVFQHLTLAEGELWSNEEEI